MTINDIPLSEFNAKLLSRKITPAQLQVGGFWPKKSLLPFRPKDRRSYYKQLDLSIEMQGFPHLIELNKSMLLLALSQSTISFDSLEHQYTGELNKSSIGTQELGYEVINASLLVYEHESELAVSMTQETTKQITLSSNKSTPVKLTITPTANIPSLTIQGLGSLITLENLQIGRSIIIDARNGNVEEDGLPKYHDYDSWSFPKLQPGENTIVLSHSSLEMLIQFSPLWA